MKKVWIRSAIAAVAVEVIGAVINLISYWTHGGFLLAIRLTGGEWMGWEGFGLLLNRTYPMTTSDNPDVHGSVWINLDLPSLVVTLFVAFTVSFIIFLLIHLIKKRSEQKKSQRDIRN